MFTNDANGPDCWHCSLNVEWHDCTFCPVIELRRGARRRAGLPAKPVPGPAILPHPVRRKNLFKSMKINLFKMRRSRTGFTLVELLTVIAIIGILAAMLLPVLSAAKTAALKTKAKTEINDLVTDIQAYDQTYGKFPTSHFAQTVAGYGQFVGASKNFDFTYGGTIHDPSGSGGLLTVGTPIGGGNILSNSEVVAILMDYTNFPNNPAVATINTNHQSNPQQTKFLNAHLSGWDPTQPGTPKAGVGNDLVYRDPWGNPYIISMDLNYDEQCQDWFYGQKSVSSQNNSTAGYFGLHCLGTTPSDTFQFHGKVMVWSAGPDGKVDLTKPANADVNKDNILSWQ